jgi:hypothetical protein
VKNSRLRARRAVVCLRAYRAVVLGVGTVFLAGCVTKVTLPQRQALDALVGKSQPELVGELGKPTAIKATPAGTRVVYGYHSLSLQSDDIGAPSNPELTLRNHAQVVAHDCDTVFNVAGGQVTGWSVAGSDCADAPYPYLGSLKRQALEADLAQGRNPRVPFLFNSRTGESLVLSGEFQDH